MALVYDPTSGFVTIPDPTPVAPSNSGANVPGMTFTTTVTDLPSNVQNVINKNAASQGMTPEQYLASRGGVDPITGVYGNSAAADSNAYLTDAAYTTAAQNGNLLSELNKAAGKDKTTTGGGTTGTNASSSSTSLSAADTTARQNIFDQVQALFTTYGIIKPGDPASDALLKTIKDLAMSGAGADTISLQLQQSDAYKARFAGNETRRAAGLNILSPAEYIATENAYDQILRAAGVPTGFYNSSAEKAKLIGADVSASELQSRVDLAAKSISGADPFYTQQLKNLYGLSQGDMIAHVLDPSAAMPLLQQQTQSTTIAAAAARNATNINLTTAEQLAGMGVTQAQAEQGFGNIASQLPGMQAIASRYQGYGDAGTVGTGLQAATFGAPIGGETAAQAEARLKRLQTQEVSAFGGSAGASTQGQSLGVANQQGVQ